MFNINEKHLGEFWVENDKEKCFCGNIDLNTKNFKLECCENFEIPSDDKEVLINGKVGKKSISFILFNYPLDSKYYLIYDIYVGMHFNTKEDIKFEKIEFKINNISSVINLHSLKSNLSDMTPLEREPFEKFPPILIDDFALEIELNNHREKWKSRGNGKKITFEEDISIIIEYEKPQKIETIYENITRIERLFTLLTGKSEITELKGIKGTKEINILSEYLLKENNDKWGHAIQLNNIEEVFKNWLTKYDKMSSVYDLFFSINESKKVNPITLFLTYSQILENYHRQKHGGKPSLKNRLIEVFNELKSYVIFDKILKKYAKDSDKSIEELAEIIKNSRNYYTHYDKKIDTFLPESKIYKINNSICKIIQLIMLKEIGFESDEINKYIDYPQFYLWDIV